MSATNYDEVAPSYDQRYQRYQYAGTAAALTAFAGSTPQRMLELGCGTGHWLEQLTAQGHHCTGVDPSPGMLHKARARRTAQLVQAHAEALPFPAEQFDRVYIVNALHHFRDPARAIQEISRVLSPRGAALIIGLDPSCGQDDWYIYDYFPGTLEHDRARYPSTHAISGWFAEVGLQEPHSFVAERIEQQLPARAALASGAVGRHVTSQLSELSDADYAAGIVAIEQAAAAAESRGGTLQLHAHLHLFATVARSAGPQPSVERSGSCAALRFTRSS